MTTTKTTTMKAFQLTLGILALATLTLFVGDRLSRRTKSADKLQAAADQTSDLEQRGPLGRIAESVVVYSDRPWLNRSNAAYFMFTSDEWTALTNTFSDLVIAANGAPGVVLKLPQGLVANLAKEDWTMLANEWPQNVRTNDVWFYK